MVSATARPAGFPRKSALYVSMAISRSTCPIIACHRGSKRWRARMPLAIADIADHATAALYERKLVLVRPDGHVAWRGDEPPGDPRALIDAVRGAA